MGYPSQTSCGDFCRLFLMGARLNYSLINGFEGAFFFGMETGFWLNLQAHYDLAVTREVCCRESGSEPSAGGGYVSRGGKKQDPVGAASRRMA